MVSVVFCQLSFGRLGDYSRSRPQLRYNCESFCALRSYRSGCIIGRRESAATGLSNPGERHVWSSNNAPYGKDDFRFRRSRPNVLGSGILSDAKPARSNRAGYEMVAGCRSWPLRRRAECRRYHARAKEPPGVPARALIASLLISVTVQCAADQRSASAAGFSSSDPSPVTAS